MHFLLELTIVFYENVTRYLITILMQMSEVFIACITLYFHFNQSVLHDNKFIISVLMLAH